MSWCAQPDRLSPSISAPSLCLISWEKLQLHRERRSGRRKWAEVALVEWWREGLAENALTALVEAHRPMVVNMAQKFVGARRKLLIEYGMLGLRIAAVRQRASKTKKGEMAGFDPAKGFRFNTYARRVVERYMVAADQAWQLLGAAA